MTMDTMQRWYVVRNGLQAAWRTMGGPALTRRLPWLRGLLTSYRWLIPAYHRQWAYERANREAPWWTPGAIQRLEQIMQPYWIAFEWGSGRSTYWLAKRVKQITSIETSAEWFARLRPVQGSNILMRFVPLDSAYAIDGLVNASLDLIVIDGIDRLQCLRHALPKLKPDGWLVLDDFESLIYRDLRAMVRGWPGVELYDNGLMETALIRLDPLMRAQWRGLWR